MRVHFAVASPAADQQSTEMHPLAKRSIVRYLTLYSSHT